MWYRKKLRFVRPRVTLEILNSPPLVQFVLLYTTCNPL